MASANNKPATMFSFNIFIGLLAKGMGNLDVRYSDIVNYNSMSRGFDAAIQRFPREAVKLGQRRQIQSPGGTFHGGAGMRGTGSACVVEL